MDNSKIGLAGETSDYFHRYKVSCLKRWVPELDRAAAILDFGCGIGGLSSFMAGTFPQAKILGCDISRESIDIAREKWKHVGNACFKTSLPDDDAYDLITAANVFHHIRAADRRGTLLKLARLLKPNGAIAVFEHNPLNPLTRYVVRHCPFDAEAELISPRQFTRLARGCGLKVALKRYIVFFPRCLSLLRWIEPSLGFLPAGAQYMLLLTRAD